MTAAVRKKDEELTINLKCIIGVLMTDSGLCLDGARHRTAPHRARAVYIYPSQRSMSFMLATTMRRMSIPKPTYSALTRKFSLGLRRVVQRTANLGFAATLIQMPHLHSMIESREHCRRFILRMNNQHGTILLQALTAKK